MATVSNITFGIPLFVMILLFQLQNIGIDANDNVNKKDWKKKDIKDYRYNVSDNALKLILYIFEIANLNYPCHYVNVLIFSDADLERLYEQWEEDEEPLPVDELPEWDPRKPQPQVSRSQADISTYKVPKC